MFNYTEIYALLLYLKLNNLNNTNIIMFGDPF